MPDKRRRPRPKRAAQCKPHRRHGIREIQRPLIIPYILALSRAADAHADVSGRRIVRDAPAKEQAQIT